MLAMAKNTQRPLLSPTEAKATLAAKGWSNRGLAEWWDCTEEYVCRVLSNPNRRRWFDDSIRSLPQFGTNSKSNKVEQ